MRLSRPQDSGLTHTGAGMLSKMRANICSHRDTFTICVLPSWGKLLAPVGSDDLLTYTRSGAKVNSVVQDNAKEGIVDVDLAVVLDETQLPEFVHEEIDPGPRCANHLRQHLLRYLG
jgi:hypothetical protein